MRLRKFTVLLAKEWDELLASRAYWLLLLIIGPLVGQSFISAVNLYAEVSGTGGTAALSQGLTPLDGILVPTFGAYDLAVTLLFPFVAIRLVSAEKESGALKLLMQFPASLGTTLAAKGTILLVGWFVAWLPGIFAIILWSFYGGHLYAPEVLNLLFGHSLRLLLSSSVAIAAAAITDSAASAAIVTLAFTLGTWALDFVAAGQGGLLQLLAAYTPTAALRYFEQGLFRLNTIAVMLVFTVTGFAFASVWLHTGRPWRTRLLQTSVLVLVTGAILSGGGALRQNAHMPTHSNQSRRPQPPSRRPAPASMRGAESFRGAERSEPTRRAPLSWAPPTTGTPGSAHPARTTTPPSSAPRTAARRPRADRFEKREPAGQDQRRSARPRGPQ